MISRAGHNKMNLSVAVVDTSQSVFCTLEVLLFKIWIIKTASMFSSILEYQTDIKRTFDPVLIKF